MKRYRNRNASMLRIDTRVHEIIIPARYPNPGLKLVTPPDWLPADRNHLRDHILACQIFGMPCRIPPEVQVYELIEETWHQIPEPN